ncbi:MAG: hypothetical protein KKA07_10265 [Bacteroidetes bacterium]|nr:hypothetical protein [Bacteroidota bacterium]MBU1719445.1 hypothetical protein [Bacteroidota bacterium]
MTVKGNEKFKYKELKVYGSTEWMANSTKRYRTVFEKSELDYLNAEC